MRAVVVAAVLGALWGMSLVYAVTDAANPLPVRVYYVTSAQQFPTLPMPTHALIFHNGMFASPGADYDVVPGSPGSFRFRPGGLADQDRISVVTLP
jgi:hypothetical protein